jgi:hypothetical protein
MVEGLDCANALSMYHVLATNHDCLVHAGVEVPEEGAFTADVDIGACVN